MEKLTKIQSQLLEEIYTRRQVRGFFQLAIDLEIDYEHGLNCLERLEEAGLISVSNRRAGSRLLIRPRQ